MYTVDRIEDSIVVLEDRNNNTIIDVSINLFNYIVKEGDIVDFVNNQYIKNIEKTENKKKNIRSRFDRLKK